MASQGLANACNEVTRLLGVAPPVVPDVLAGDTRLTGRWRNPPFEGDVAPLEQHCIVGHIAGHSQCWVRGVGKPSTAQMVPGTLSLVPMGQASWRRSAAHMEVSNVYLGDAQLQACADLAAHGMRPQLVDRVGFSDPKLFTIMMLLCDEAMSGAVRSRLFMDRLLDLLCLQLLRLHSLPLVRAELVARRGLAAWQVKRVTAYMRDHLDRDITLQELAACVGLSRTYFCHAFRLATGCTPHEWLVRQRMERAQRLLAAPALRIIDVALAVGYQTPSAFAASFRKLTGVTPTAFRKKL